MSRFTPARAVLLLGLLVSFLLPPWLWPDAPLPAEPAWRRAATRGTGAIRHSVPSSDERPRFQSAVEIGAELSGAWLQDREGFLWIGSYGGGLYRFDGQNLRRYAPSTNVECDSNVTSLCEADDGTIWIGGLGGLYRYRKSIGVFAPLPLAEWLGTEPGIWSIHPDADGSLWLGTNGRGLLHFRPAEGERDAELSVYQHDPADPLSVPHDNIYKIEPARGGGLWLATFGGGAARFDPERGTQLVLGTLEGLSSSHVWSIRESRDGRVWIGTQAGLDRFDPDGASLHHYEHVPGETATLGGRVVTDVREDERGTLWVTSFDGDCSLSSLDPATDRFRRFGPAYGLGRRGARTVFEDRSGMFWVVTMGGLAKFDRNHVGFDLTQLGSGLLPIYEDRHGTIWLGTMEGLRRFDRDSGEVQAVREPELAKKLVSAIYEDSGDRFWLATYGGELLVFDRARDLVTRRFEPDQTDPRALPESNCIRRIQEDVLDPRRLWLVTQGGGLVELDTETGEARRHRHDPADPRSLSNDTASYGAFWQDPDGGLWVGTDDGLNRRLPGEDGFRRYRAAGDSDGLRSSVIQALHRDARGDLWVATADGLHRLVSEADGRFEAFTTADGLSDNMVLGILEHDDRLWLSTPHGLTALDLTGERPVEVYGRDDGLEEDAFLMTSFFKTGDGEFWFGGPRGVNHFRPSRPEDVAFPPPVVLTSLTQGGRPIELGCAPSYAREIELEWPSDSFEFGVAALGFSMPASNRFRYRLEGVDHDWYESRIGAGRYSGLGGGEYLLRVQAAGGAGVWNEEGVSLRVRVRPPFWHSQWFLSALLLIATIALYGCAYYVELLVREVKQRRAAERERDAAEQRLRESARLEALGKLASGVAHDFNNLLTVVLAEADLIRLKLERGGVEAARKGLAAIEAAALRGADLTTQLLAFNSRRSSAPRDVEFERVVRDSSRFFERVLGEDVELVFRFDAPGAVVHIDPGKLHQVLMNLVVNARHAMAAGGRLTITTSRLDTDPSFSRREAEWGVVILTVADTGHGMDPPTVERIFDPYFTTKRAGEGTGLGLSIVREVVDTHAGRIRVESRPGEGSRFEVLFPIVGASPTDEPPQALPVSGEADAAHGTVLLVEDDVDVRDVLQSMLESAGFEVVATALAEEARQQWQRDAARFDLVISDVVLPDGGGDRVVERIRDERPDFPVLFISGYTPERVHLDPPGDGPWAALEKPIRPEDLVRTLVDLLARHAASSTSSA